MLTVDTAEMNREPRSQSLAEQEACLNLVKERIFQGGKTFPLFSGEVNEPAIKLTKARLASEQTELISAPGTQARTHVGVLRVTQRGG